MLGSPILYLKGMRIMMFQLSGYYYRVLALSLRIYGCRAGAARGVRKFKILGIWGNELEGRRLLIAGRILFRFQDLVRGLGLGVMLARSLPPSHSLTLFFHLLKLNPKLALNLRFTRGFCKLLPGFVFLI